MYRLRISTNSEIRRNREIRRNESFVRTFVTVSQLEALEITTLESD